MKEKISRNIRREILNGNLIGIFGKGFMGSRQIF